MLSITDAAFVAKDNFSKSSFCFEYVRVCFVFLMMQVKQPQRLISSLNLCLNLYLVSQKSFFDPKKKRREDFKGIWNKRTVSSKKFLLLVK